jgi:Fe2+ or Zn2+ uptake regulation protein
MIDIQPLFEKLKRSGFKVTRQRKAILEVLALAGAPLPAPILLKQVRDIDGNISADTLYRNLYLLLELGMLCRIGVRGGDLFELNFPEHHHHLICLSCGNVTCLDHCPLTKMQSLYEEKNNFKVTDHVFDLYGYCHECQGKL